MARPLIIAPSILASDFSILGQEINSIDESGADWIHLDVMDGHFVPNISFGAPVIKAVRSVSNLTFDTHLMIQPADPYLADFAESGSDLITVHTEAGPHLDRTLQTIRNLGKRAGVAVNPATPLAEIAHVLDRVDLILIMSVNPGFGGQSFISESLNKISQARELIGDRDIDLEVDGGISPENAAQVARAGANVLVAGSSILRAGRSNYASAIAVLRDAAESGRN